MFQRYFKNEQGQGMSEYLILVLLIAVASITVSQQVGKTVYGKLKDVNNGLKTVTLESVRNDSN
jgi:Flp pilus assembly pilin Flp